MSLKINRSAGTPARTVYDAPCTVPGTPGRIESVEVPSTSFPRDYQVKVTRGLQGSGAVKLHSMKQGSETGSIHVSRADLRELVRLMDRGEI